MAMAVLALAGCGRPATREDCDAMLKKSIELKLVDENNAEVRAQKLADYTQMLRSQVDGCIGRRVTDDYLRCVKSATSDAQLKACRKE